MEDEWIGMTSSRNMTIGCLSEVLSCPEAVTFPNGEAAVIIPEGPS